MPEQNQRAPQAVGRPVQPADKHAVITARFEQFEKRQRELWLMAITVIILLGLAYAWTSWDAVRSLAHHYEALPIGFVVLIVLFGLYMWRKTQEISELRGLMRGMEHRDEAPPSDKQLDQLFAIKQIAWLLGYSQVGAFNHAYRRWTGTSPARARQRQPPGLP